jgi:hypothetical protein
MRGLAHGVAAAIDDIERLKNSGLRTQMVNDE